MNYKGFAEWIIRQRKDKLEGISQEELAKRTGVQKAYISKYETAAAHPEGRLTPTPSLKFLLRLSQVCGTDISEPLLALGLLKTDSKTQPHVMRLLHYYNSLPREDQKLAEEIIKTLWQQRAPKSKPEKTPKKRIA